MLSKTTKVKSLIHCLISDEYEEAMKVRGTACYMLIQEICFHVITEVENN